jgi:hypothetical protein
VKVHITVGIGMDAIIITGFNKGPIHMCWMYYPLFSNDHVTGLINFTKLWYLDIYYINKGVLKEPTIFIERV